MRPPPWLYLTLGLTAAAVSVSGCGFQPVYGARTTAVLEHIDVQVGQGRIPFLIRESLLDQLARDRDVPPVYRVRLEVRQGRFPLGNRVNNIANR